MHKIAVISDTHGRLREEVSEQAGTCDAILHAGDAGSMEIIQALKKIAPLYVVRGNIDGEWAAGIPEELYFTLYGFNFYMVHNRKHIKADISKTDIIIYGHSHKYKEEYAGNVLYLNPGSCGPGRFRHEVTMAVITLDEGAHKFYVKKKDCLHMQDTGTPEEGAPYKDMDRLVRTVIKDMESGKGIPGIARKNGIPEELAEKICRIYSTHNGIDVDGILNRLDIWNL
ncbi:MAG: metallophosphoesterase family protein [Lachnospiraceae bacterium]|nr:metallophosphoesterase family protein [Lachnospiraceae bacterium]